jgi:hypothetical protein
MKGKGTATAGTCCDLEKERREVRRGGSEVLMAGMGQRNGNSCLRS